MIYRDLQTNKSLLTSLQPTSIAPIPGPLGPLSSPTPYHRRCYSSHKILSQLGQSSSTITMAPTTTDLFKCAQCSATYKFLKQCAKCHSTAYCDRACQEPH